jgi:hypothetical protein
MNIIDRKCHYLIFTLLKSNPTTLANQTEARFGFVEYPELPVHVFRYKKAPANKAEANFESEWRRGRVELPVQKKVARISYKLSQLLLSHLAFIC